MDGLLHLGMALSAFAATVLLALAIGADSPEDRRRVLRDFLS